MNSRRKLVPLAFVLAATLFALAAVLPAVRGESFHGAYLALGIAFAILGGVTWRKAGNAGRVSS